MANVVYKIVALGGAIFKCRRQPLLPALRSPRVTCHQRCCTRISIENEAPGTSGGARDSRAGQSGVRLGKSILKWSRDADHRGS